MSVNADKKKINGLLNLLIQCCKADNRAASDVMADIFTEAARIYRSL